MTARISARALSYCISSLVLAVALRLPEFRGTAVTVGTDPSMALSGIRN